MTEERLKEICDYNNTEYCVGEYDINNEIIDELYNEVVRLRKIIDEATKEYWDGFKEDDLTLEQLNGVENE